MRLDRFLTLILFGPLCRTGATRRRRRFPILMYHSVSDKREDRVSPYYRTATHPSAFARQMKLLQSMGYKGVNLKTWRAAFDAGQLQNAKLAVLTFDDGFRDFYTSAFPFLNQYGFSATVFLPTGFIGESSRAFKSRGCLTWSEVRELHAAGIQFGSHTVTHPKLVDLSWQAVRNELRDSKAEIERRLGSAVDSFAYPYAFPGRDARFVTYFRQELRDAGYACCATTELGCVKPGDDPYRLKRLPVNSVDDAALFRAKLEGGYDWLAFPQSVVKKFKLSSSRKRNGVPGQTARAVSN